MTDLDCRDALETANFAKPMTRQKSKNEKKTELEFCKRAGVESLLAQGSRHSKGRKVSKRKTDSSNNHKAKHTANKTSINKASGKKTSRKSKPNGKTVKPRPNQPGYLNDLGSLFNSNVYDDANSNLHLPGLAPLPHANKEKLLKALLAGVPTEDQRACRGQKANIIRSTRILGGCKSDGAGKWKLKGKSTFTFSSNT